MSWDSFRSCFSEIGPVLGTGDTAVDKRVVPTGNSERRQKTIKFLDNRYQVVMNAMKKDEVKEESREDVGRPLRSGKVWEDPE